MRSASSSKGTSQAILARLLQTGGGGGGRISSRESSEKCSSSASSLKGLKAGVSSRSLERLSSLPCLKSRGCNASILC